MRPNLNGKKIRAVWYVDLRTIVSVLCPMRCCFSRQPCQLLHRWFTRLFIRLQRKVFLFCEWLVTIQRLIQGIIPSSAYSTSRVILLYQWNVKCSCQVVHFALTIYKCFCLILFFRWLLWFVLVCVNPFIIIIKFNVPYLF